MKDPEAFKDAVKKYTRQAQRKHDGKPATMEDLAVTIGFTREALSKKLNGKSSLDARDIRNIVRGLAALDAITSRSQAMHLLDLMGVTDFEPVDWDAEPLSKLINKSKVDELAINPPQSKIDELAINPPQSKIDELAISPSQSKVDELAIDPSQGKVDELAVSPSQVEPASVLPLASVATTIPPKHFQSSTSYVPLRRKWLMASFLLIFILIIFMSSIAFYVLPRYHLVILPRDDCPIPSSTDKVKDIYTFATCNSRQVMADPLHAQSPYDWDQNERCFFSGGAYHVIVPKTDFVSECFAQKAPAFSDFALQVDMTILQGGSGGLLFRAESTNAHDVNAVAYRVPIDDNGSYNFYLGKDLPCAGLPVSVNWCRSSQNIFHRTLGKKNTITIVALEDTIYFYTNGQFVDSARNTYSASGYIGVFANAYHNTVEVMFSSLKVWAW